MALRVRTPEDVIIQLSDGDWILVKKWLSAGEANNIKTRMVKTIKQGTANPDGTGKIDMDYDLSQLGGLSQTIEYLLDWSAKDTEDKPIVIRDQSADVIASALLSLPEDSYDEVEKAVGDHVKKMAAERKARKNDQVGETASSATSPSVAT